MSYNGSGAFQINTVGQPVVVATTIDATVFNTLTADVATGLSTAICKDGQTTITADIPLNAHKLTGVAAATARTDAASLATIQDGTGVYVATVAGTADVITLTASPSIAAYVAGQTFKFIASGANTTNVTVAINGLAAKAITKNGTTALAAGDIPSASIVTITYDGVRFILTGIMGVTQTVTVSQGGTGLTTLTAHALYVGNSTSAPTALAVGATNTVLHGLTGADPAYSAVVEADITLADNTTNNVTSTAHGFCPKAPADATKFLNGANPPAYAVPVGTLTAGSTLTQNPFATNATVTQAHGLGAHPHMVITYLECLTAELGYSIGDRVRLEAEHIQDGTSASSGGVQIVTDATNVVLITSSATLPLIHSKSTRLLIAITAANWKVIAIPYKIN